MVGLVIVMVQGLFPHCESCLDGEQVFVVTCISRQLRVDVIHGQDHSRDVGGILREKQSCILEDLK